MGCNMYIYIYVGLSPFPVIVTTRIITFLVGNPYKPSFPLLLGRGTTQYIWLYVSMLNLGLMETWIANIHGIFFLKPHAPVCRCRWVSFPHFGYIFWFHVSFREWEKYWLQRAKTTRLRLKPLNITGFGLDIRKSGAFFIWASFSIAGWTRRNWLTKLKILQPFAHRDMFS